MITASETNFVRLIRFALLDNKTPLNKLSSEQWEEIAKIARDHAMTGILYCALEKMPRDLLPEKEILLKTYSITQQIEKQNRFLNTRLISIFNIYDGFEAKPMLLKGQGVASCYENPLRRNSGDIDVFINNNFDKVNAWAHTQDKEAQDYEPELDKHVHFHWQNVMVENHFMLARFFNRATDKKMQEITEEGLKAEAPLIISIDSSKIELLPPTLYLLHLITHFAHHLMDWGIGLRQLCDIIMFINRYHNSINQTMLQRWITELHLERVASAIVTIGTNDLGLNQSYAVFKSKEGEKYAATLLSTIITAGNFSRREMGITRRSFSYRFRFYIHNLRRTYSFMPDEVKASFAGKARLLVHRLRKGDTDI